MSALEDLDDFFDRVDAELNEEESIVDRLFPEDGSGYELQRSSEQGGAARVPFIGQEAMQSYLDSPYIDVRIDVSHFSLDEAMHLERMLSGGIIIKPSFSFSRESSRRYDPDLVAWGLNPVEMERPNYSSRIEIEGEFIHAIS